MQVQSWIHGERQSCSAETIICCSISINQQDTVPWFSLKEMGVGTASILLPDSLFAALCGLSSAGMLGEGLKTAWR